ncbi:MAG: tRNA (adenosine(37)-N6)-threonylcarbamoyltransferase complex ATPase subunit type 1 TsaE [Patescibacteria group bacterium]|nr:tRNA (adenosine(37)-N6)-threonylcarbamoyltransferase complex ATPase subunit type 1 TsaE [Patescibacteria group bacterium]
MNHPRLIPLSQAKTTGARLALKLRGGEILALIGPLGTGKTTFTKALGRALKAKHKITSPTFVLMRALPIKLRGQAAILYHLDLYRIHSLNELKSLGIAQVWGRPGTVTVIEWADKIKRALPKKTRFLHFNHDRDKKFNPKN